MSSTKSMNACLASKPFSRSPLSIIYFHANRVALSMSVALACINDYKSPTDCASLGNCSYTKHQAMHSQKKPGNTTLHSYLYKMFQCVHCAQCSEHVKKATTEINLVSSI